MMLSLHLSVCFLVAIVVAADATFVNTKVDRILDISSQLVKVTVRVSVEGSGTEYELPLDSEPGYTSVNSEGTAVSFKFVTSTNKLVIDVKGLKAPFNLEIKTIQSHRLIPHPAEIAQSDKQLVLYQGSHYLTSPYVTKTQSTKIRLPISSGIESYTKLKPTASSGSNIDCGPYENIQPNVVSPLTVHYENNSPFLTVTNLEREVELSHWGGVITVQDDISMSHTGAKLIGGSFSRYDFQRQMTGAASAVKSFKTKLPLSSYNIYYRDEIGNISTSNVKATSSNLLVELRPRFPLFGGWKTHYLLGWTIPASEYLFNDGNQFILRVPYIDHIHDNYVVDKSRVKVILPEGVSDVKVNVPFKAERRPDENRKTYLDVLGRTVIVLEKDNVLNSEVFEVTYSFNRVMMLQEPILIILALFALCTLVVIYTRLDFSIQTNKKNQ